MGRDNLSPIRGPVILVDDYRKLYLKDLHKLLKILYNRERVENTSRKILEDVQVFLKWQQHTKDYTLDVEWDIKIGIKERLSRDEKKAESYTYFG